jgi:hypothetical protein
VYVHSLDLEMELPFNSELLALPKLPRGQNPLIRVRWTLKA